MVVTAMVQAGVQRVEVLHQVVVAREMRGIIIVPVQEVAVAVIEALYFNHIQ